MAKTRSKGSGHLFKRGKTYYLQFDVSGKRKVVSLRTTRLRSVFDDSGTITEEGAEDKAKRLLAAKSAQTQADITRHIGESKGLLDENRLKLEEAWPLFNRRYSKKKTSAGTLRNYERQWQRFLHWLASKHPGVEFMNDVTIAIADDYVDHLEHDDVMVGSASTFNQHLGTCRRVFEVLHKDTGMSENPFTDAQRMARDSVTKRELDWEELAKVLGVFDDPGFKVAHREELEVLFHIGAWTGLRLKDAALLRWEDVELKKNRISCVPYKTRRHGTRVRIPLHPTLKSHLERARAWEGGEYVLPSTAEQYAKNEQTVKRRVVRVFKEAGFDTTVSLEGRRNPTNVLGFHSLRHSFVSFCANAGVPLASVQSIIGHTSPAMTEHYAHLNDETAQKAIDALPRGDKPEMNEGAGNAVNVRERAHALINSLPDSAVTKLVAELERMVSESGDAWQLARSSSMELDKR